MHVPSAASFAALACAVLAAGSLACSSTPNPPHPPGAGTGTAQVPSAAAADWSAVLWRPVTSVVHGFSMPLPEDAGWKLDDSEDAWFVATHAATSTQVAARMLQTDGLANRARCEAHASEVRKLPDREGAAVLDRRRVDLPDGFDTVLEVGLLATPPGQPITGYAIAFGGWAKKCFAYVLTTSAKGKGAEEAVGDRLALFVERSFLHIKFSSSLGSAVPREKPQFGPGRP
jgi:hypothetical protein